MRIYHVEGLSPTDGSLRKVTVQAATPSEALQTVAQQGIDMARIAQEEPAQEDPAPQEQPNVARARILARSVRLAVIAVLAVGAAGFLLFAPVRAQHREIAARTRQLDQQSEMIRHTAEEADRRAAEARANPYRQRHYRELRTGMSYADAVELLGGPGTELSSVVLSGVSARVYSWSNADGSNIVCTFQNDQLVGKSQFALRY